MTNRSQRLEALRALVKSRGMDGFIVPRTDEFQGEFVPPCAERLKWLTGFTGSAGIAAILMDRAVVMSDGRYTIQLKNQIDAALFETGDSVQEGVGAWLAAHAPEGGSIGYDPWLHTPGQIERIGAALEKASLRLVPVAGNPVDEIWEDRPEEPLGNIEVFPEEIAGKSLKKKCKEVSRILKNRGVFACVLTLPDSVSWVLNVRGSDVEYLPAALSRAIVYADGRPARWFVDQRKLLDEVVLHVSGVVDVIDFIKFSDEIAALSREAAARDLPVLLDFSNCPQAVVTQIREAGAGVVDGRDPCITPKALKTGAEQGAIRRAHAEDGAAIVRFLRWLDAEAVGGGLSEIEAGDKLLSFRRMSQTFRGESFPVIAGFAANGAIVHYRAAPETNAKILPPGLLLVDSGGQYGRGRVYGTTDITRTIAVGEPAEEMRRHYTLVLKGHVALSRARFPEGTTGAQIDVLARQPLWNEGLDFAHGTGHGVGCYLSVHEEAAGISPRGKEPLKAGMLLSNEPGYYREGAYGIRIENLVLVREDGVCGDTGARMLRFETVTLAPYDRNLIVPEMLAREEREWLDEYHAVVFGKLKPLLDPDTATWLCRQTRPLAESL